MALIVCLGIAAGCHAASSHICMLLGEALPGAPCCTVYAPMVWLAQRVVVSSRLASCAPCRRKTLFSCPRCWLLPTLCVCDKLPRVSAPRTKLIIHMHHNEWVS